MTDSGSRQGYAVSCANTHAAAIDAIKAMREPSGDAKPVKLRDLAKRLGLNAGYLSQILSGKRAPSMKVYKALGLTPPARVIEVQAGYDVAPVCPKCGVVHTTKRCIAGQKRKPRTKAFKIEGRRYYRHEGTDQI